MTRLLAALLLLVFIAVACNESASDSNKELALKEKEIALKEKELELKEKSDEAEMAEPAAEPSEEEASPAQPNELSNKEMPIGNWFKPGEATVNIKFYRNGRFEFNDYNSVKEEEELLEGDYELKDGTLTLKYDDSPGQKFKFYKDGTEFYIKKGSYYFVKGDN